MVRDLITDESGTLRALAVETDGERRELYRLADYGVQDSEGFLNENLMSICLNLYKTGTVNGVSTLSGYLKARNGHILAFSILMNSITGSASARSLQNILCIEMCR